MATPKALIRTEVLKYLNACANLLVDKPGSDDEFVAVSKGLQQQQKIRYTDEELGLVQRMLRRISKKRGK